MKKFLKENILYIITILITIIIFNYKLPFYVNAPGGTININDRINYSEKITPNGSLNMLYVTQYQATIPIYLLSYLNKNWDLESIEQNQINNENYQEIDTRNKIMLENSVANATYVAYTSAGKKIEIKKEKNIVIGTIDDNPLLVGDEILQINNQDINSLDEIKEIVSKYEVGDKINIKILRNNKEKELEIEIKELESGKGIGAIVMINYEYTTNPNIELKFKKSESGASGGLMMALSIYSALSDIDLLRGRNIAGTGTIDIYGNVGKIDGIKYKVMGAVRNNMDVVLVPVDNYQEAKKVVEDNNYDIELVSIKNFNDAINYLKAS